LRKRDYDKMSETAFNLVYLSYRDLDVSANAQLQLLKRCVNELLKGSKCTYDERSIIVNRFIAAERRLGNFSLNGLYLPHLVAEEAQTCAENKVGWFVWRSSQMRGAGMLCCCVYGSRVFVKEVCELAVSLIELPSFLEGALKFSSIPDFRAFIREHVEKVKNLETQDKIIAVSNTYAEDDWIEVHVDIWNRLGLHARASAKFVNVASKFSSDIQVCVNCRSEKVLNGKSIMGVMMAGALGGWFGRSIIVSARGPDASQAIAALAELIHQGFGEAEPGTPGTANTCISVECDVRSDQSLFIRGNLEPLSWSKGLAMKMSGRNKWTWCTNEFRGPNIPFEFKVLLYDEIWEELPVQCGQNHVAETFTYVSVTAEFGD